MRAVSQTEESSEPEFPSSKFSSCRGWNFSSRWKSGCGPEDSNKASYLVLRRKGFQLFSIKQHSRPRVTGSMYGIGIPASDSRREVRAGHSSLPAPTFLFPVDPRAVLHRQAVSDVFVCLGSPSIYKTSRSCGLRTLRGVFYR